RMRDYTSLTVIPGSYQVILDGEAYSCAPFTPGDVQGSVRKVPGDRILAIQWHGEHSHGSVEGFGVMEGFTDKTQLALYVVAWLKARAKAKANEVAALQRQRNHQDEAIASNGRVAASVKGDIAALEGDSDPMAQERLKMVRRNLTEIEAAIADM